MQMDATSKKMSQQSRKGVRVCAVCCDEHSKYRCPGCNMQTCVIQTGWLKSVCQIITL